MTKEQFEKIIKHQVNLGLKEKGLSETNRYTYIDKYNLYIIKLESEVKEVFINVELVK